MRNDNCLELLKNCELFGRLSQAQLTRFVSYFQPLTFKRGEVLFLKNERADALYLIKQGRVKINTVNSEGKDLTVRICRAGEIVGEMALLDGQPRSMSAIALEQVEAFSLKRETFEQLIKEEPCLVLGLVGILLERLRATNEQLEMLGLLDAADRVAFKLMQLAVRPAQNSNAGVVDISQQELASMVGLSREWLNKILQSYVDKGLVELGWGKITITSVSNLKASLRCA